MIVSVKKATSVEVMKLIETQNTASIAATLGTKVRVSQRLQKADRDARNQSHRQQRRRDHRGDPQPLSQHVEDRRFGHIGILRIS